MKTLAGPVAALCCLCFSVSGAPAGFAQEGSHEITVHVDVNSLLVPVVVRDAQGRALGDLKQEDFKVLDEGKPRKIVALSLEKSEAGQVGAELPTKEPGGTVVPSANPSAATRYIVFLFDDRHLGPGEMERAKAAGAKLLEQPLADGDRAVVLSFMAVNSGMTHDRAALVAGLAKLKPQQGVQHDAGQCPDIDYATADALINRHSKTEWDTQIERAANCAHMSSKGNISYVEQLVRTAANQALLADDQDARDTLGYVRDVVHTLSKLPGQRTLVLVSPGFLTGSGEAMALESSILDLAAGAGVTISALDARGLSAGNVGAGQTTAGSVYSNITGGAAGAHLEAMRDSEEGLAQLAAGTGGSFFRNSNDLGAGLKSVAAGPEYRYVLELSLDGVKQNGTYHALKVEVARGGVKVQAREGYFAPKARK